jgi:hypothetical protein
LWASAYLSRVSKSAPAESNWSPNSRGLRSW